MNITGHCADCEEVVYPGKPHNHPKKNQGEIQPLKSPDAEITKGLEIQTTFTCESIVRCLRELADGCKTNVQEGIVCMTAADIIDKLRAKDEALRKYGGHTHDCKYTNFLAKQYTSTERQCICGWVVLEQALKGKP